jgi:energy-coupling factor transporter ATP-binding protein EcfA2
MDYITNVAARLFNGIASFVKRRSKAKVLRLYIGRFSYSLSNTLVFENVHGSLEMMHSMRWKKRHGRAFITPSYEANPHIIVFGMSGQGKSTLLRSMIFDMSHAGKPAIIFDAHNEHAGVVSALGGRVIDSSRSGINIFSLDGSTVGERISELSQLFQSVYSLGYVQSQKLAECMWYAYRKCGASSRNDMQLQRLPTITSVLGELNIFINNSKNVSEKSSLTHLRSRLSSLALQLLSEGKLDVASLRTGISSFSLAGIRSSEAQIIYINELLRRLYINMKSGEIEKGVSLYIIIDEAQFIINDSDSKTVKKLMEEGRKYGVGIILATHMASSLPREIIANSSTFITFYSREPQEINYISNILSSGISSRAFEIKRMLHRLRKNEALVLSYGIREPSVIETPTAESLLAYTSNPEPEVTPHAPLKPVLSYQDTGIGKNEGMQEMNIAWHGANEHWIMKKNSSLSIEHEVMVKKIFEELDSNGIKAIIMDNSRGPDVIAYMKGKRVAIEYETGRKSISSTSAMIKKRLDEYALVVIVVNEVAADFYRNYFEGERVKVLSAFRLSDLGKVLMQI